jgi:hypothetical protein
MGVHILPTRESHRQWIGTNTYSGPANSGEPIALRGNLFAAATATLQAFGPQIQFLSDLGKHPEFNAYWFSSSERADQEWRADEVTIVSHHPPVEKDPGKIFMLSAVLADNPFIIASNEHAPKDEEKKRVNVIPIEAWLFDLQYNPNINTPTKLVIAHLIAGFGNKSNTYLESASFLKLMWKTDRGNTTIGFEFQDNSQPGIKDMDRILLSQARFAHPFLTQYLQSMFHIDAKYPLLTIPATDVSLANQKSFALWGVGSTQSALGHCIPAFVRNV